MKVASSRVGSVNSLCDCGEDQMQDILGTRYHFKLFLSQRGVDMFGACFKHFTVEIQHIGSTVISSAYGVN